YPPYTTISLSIPFSLDRLVQSAPLGLFFLLVFVFFFSLGASVFKSKKHGVLLAGLVISYLIFRLIHLTHPFFLILLLALFFVLELFVSTRENTK
ncbi:MAG TPA: hypothetical protein VNW29_04630, partial [Candidatus Sulfotelmatobacter sp.]|nr:hypothetical protein [Candidatus Sulfotelmatobacter sp.]